MNDRLLIYAGLILFLALVTYPVWYGVAANSSTAGPVVQKVAGKTSCVAPRDEMRRAHMSLLMSWRESKVREQRQQYTAYDGEVYSVSLTDTCLTQCHGTKERFCDSCHSFAGVPVPDCWGCHISPGTVEGEALSRAGGLQ